MDHGEPSEDGAAAGAAKLSRRRFGATGPELSILGFGSVLVSGVSEREAAESVAFAVERGVNFFDASPTYGNAEERLGPALAPYRAGCFLATRTTNRDAAGAREQLTRSLARLKTDRLDLYQLQGLSTREDVERVFAPGGAMETLVAAREEGIVRYLGFSTHDTGTALDALSRFPFDSVLVPLNAVCIENGGFGPRVIGKARETGAAVLALKALAWTKLGEGEESGFEKCWYRPAGDPELAALLLRYTLDLPVTSVFPPGDPELFRLAVEVALRYRPLEESERETLLARLAGVEPLIR